MTGNWMGTGVDTGGMAELVAMNDSVNAITTTETVSPTFMSAGNWLRK